MVCNHSDALQVITKIFLLKKIASLVRLERMDPKQQQQFVSHASGHHFNHIPDKTNAFQCKMGSMEKLIQHYWIFTH